MGETILEVHGEYCRLYGHSCTYPSVCCADTCCMPTESQDRHTVGTPKPTITNMWNMWYSWFLVLFMLIICFGICGYWRKRKVFLAQQHLANTQGRIDTMSHCENNARLHHSVPPFLHGILTLYPGRNGLTIQLQDHNQGNTVRNLQMPLSPPPYSEVITKYPEYTIVNSEDIELPPYPGPPIGVVNDNVRDCNVNEINVGEEADPPPYTRNIIQNCNNESDRSSESYADVEDINRLSNTNNSESNEPLSTSNNHQNT